MDAVTAPLIETDRASVTAGMPLAVRWLGRIGYRVAWDLQHRLADARAIDRIGDQLLLLEHDRVLTLGRYADESHVLAGPAELARRGIEVIRVERGGEVTYHGPGQLVAYPILGLSRRGLMLRPLVRALEGAMIDTCSAFGVSASRRDGHPGCWCDADGPDPRKIGALGIRVARGVTFHGIALNVAVDLAAFDLIDPCGMPGVESTSIVGELARRGDDGPATAAAAATAAHLAGTPGVARAASAFAQALGVRLDAPLQGAVPSDDVELRGESGSGVLARRDLETLLEEAEAGAGSSRGRDR